MLVVACRCETGPGSCQEARSQAGGSVWKRVGSKPSVKSPLGGASERSVPREAKPAASGSAESDFGGERESRAALLTVKRPWKG